MKNLWLFAVFCLLCLPSFARTELLDESGNAYLRLCSVVEKNIENTKQSEVGDEMACLFYTHGFASGVEFGRSFASAKAGQKISAPFCAPDDIERGQMVRIVLKYIRNNPAQANQVTSFLIVLALAQAYPCPHSTLDQK